ncbi:unnamed protein product, partial [Rotaria sp. Silwood1]
MNNDLIAKYNLPSLNVDGRSLNSNDSRDLQNRPGP